MKSLKKLAVAFAAAAVVLLATACTTMVPVVDNGHFPADASTYTVLGTVSVSAPATNAGYTKLIAEAKKLYPAADDVVNIKIDRKTTIFLIFMFQKFEMTGVVIDYK
ncbi:MAG: hypothetical protein K6G80_00385 [Treponema sp.]|nr:hypothetical protein [Treponema sp.]